MSILEIYERTISLWQVADLATESEWETVLRTYVLILNRGGTPLIRYSDSHRYRVFDQRARNFRETMRPRLRLVHCGT